MFSVLALCLLLLLAGCSTATAPNNASYIVGTPLTSMPETYAGPINHAVPTTGCGLRSEVRPGSSADLTIAMNPAVAEGNRTRIYRLHVPLNYNPHSPIAVVLSFHGFGGSAAGMERGSGFSALADQQDFLAVYPQGLLEGYSGKPFWADVGPIDFGIDDMQYVSNVLDDLQRKFCVDPVRIYATGFSNGGGMTNFLACRLAGRIAAFAPMSGEYYSAPGGCHPGRPVALLETHGTADPLVRYNGIPASANAAWQLPSIPQWLQQWAARDGCTSGPTIFYQVAPVVGEQWTHCQGGVSIVHYRVIGGGHAGPPPINGQTSAQIIWQFFQRYTLPRA
jgi:polyhydroxybutyrate depolymerase